MSYLRAYLLTAFVLSTGSVSAKAGVEDVFLSGNPGHAWDAHPETGLALYSLTKMHHELYFQLTEEELGESKKVCNQTNRSSLLDLNNELARAIWLREAAIPREMLNRLQDRWNELERLAAEYIDARVEELTRLQAFANDIPRLEEIYAKAGVRFSDNSGLKLRLEEKKHKLVDSVIQQADQHGVGDAVRTVSKYTGSKSRKVKSFVTTNVEVVLEGHPVSDFLQSTTLPSATWNQSYISKISALEEPTEGAWTDHDLGTIYTNSESLERIAQNPSEVSETGILRAVNFRDDWGTIIRKLHWTKRLDLRRATSDSVPVEMMIAVGDLQRAVESVRGEAVAQIEREAATIHGMEDRYRNVYALLASEAFSADSPDELRQAIDQAINRIQRNLNTAISVRTTISGMRRDFSSCDLAGTDALVSNSETESFLKNPSRANGVLSAYERADAKRLLERDWKASTELGITPLLLEAR